MDEGQLLELLKLKLGISTSRDKQLEKSFQVSSLNCPDNLIIELVSERADHEMFIVMHLYRYEGQVDNINHANGTTA